MRESPLGACPRCGTGLVETPSVRHAIVLQDESDSAKNRRLERRLCARCWQAEFESLSHDVAVETSD